MGFFGFNKAEKINTSPLSDRIKPVFETAYAICREFGHEEGGYFTYRYKDQIINILHSQVKDGGTDAFCPGRQVRVEYKGRCVFDCLIKLNGDIKSVVFESGEWQRYFAALENTRKTTLLARDRLTQYYKFSEIFYTIARINTKSGRMATPNDFRDRSFNTGQYKVHYDIDRGYIFSDGIINVKFDRDEKKNVASAAVITYNGKVVFNAVHFFPSRQRPFSSNTRCKVFDRGEWEKHLDAAISRFRSLHGV